MNNTIELKEQIERSAKGIKCECGGYAELVDSTENEVKLYGCSRDKVGLECCARAFVCVLCNNRYYGSAEAPECE